MGTPTVRTQFENKCAWVTYGGHYKGCLSTEQRTEKGFLEVLRVLVVRVVQAFSLDKDNQELF